MFITKVLSKNKFTFKDIKTDVLSKVLKFSILVKDNETSTIVYQTNNALVYMSERGGIC